MAELGLPVTVIVLNNRSLGWIRWYRRINFGRGWEGEDFSDVPFADVARAFGLAGERVTEPGHLAAALRTACAAPGPALVDVVTEPWQTPIAAHRDAVGTGRPPDMEADTPMPRHPDRLIERLAQPEAARLIAASGTAVVFAGSVEQHGGHLPLGTDAFAAQSIAERVAARLGTVAVSLGPVGVAHYHLSWPGTLSLSPATLIAVFGDVCGGLARAGARRIVVGELARGELGHAAAGGGPGAGQRTGSRW